MKATLERVNPVIGFTERVQYYGTLRDKPKGWRRVWGIKTAHKYLKQVNDELINSSPKWKDVDYFACVLD